MTASVLFVGDEKEIETVEDYLHTALESHTVKIISDNLRMIPGPFGGFGTLVRLEP